MCTCCSNASGSTTILVFSGALGKTAHIFTSIVISEKNGRTFFELCFQKQLMTDENLGFSSVKDWIY
jgi:hypothetical protein